MRFHVSLHFLSMSLISFLVSLLYPVNTGLKSTCIDNLNTNTHTKERERMEIHAHRKITQANMGSEVRTLISLSLDTILS